VSHVPFLLSDDGREAELHLVRSNPIAQLINAPTPAVIAVSGPDSYISPDWYGVDDQVPTWNYVAVHLRGILEPLPQAALHPMLDRLSAHFEELLLPKPPWTTDKMSDGVMDRMMRAIVPYKMVINSINGTWKLNQNKGVSVRERASTHVLAHGIGTETKILSAMMLGAADR
jgi:transcriptional regulator